MSSVLIRGIEIPTTCRECIIGNPKAKTCIIGKSKMNTKRRDDCPLIEIPTPHGRLVDLDKMVDEYWDGSSMRIGKTDIKDIEEYDTVIEAEGSEE